MKMCLDRSYIMDYHAPELLKEGIYNVKYQLYIVLIHIS